MGGLTEALRGRSVPLMVAIEEHGCIVAADYRFDTTFDFGVAFLHPEGEIVIGANGCLEDLDPHLSEYLPGFEILRSLCGDERARLGLREVDIGGPASGGCWAVAVRASAEELDAVLATKGLPFRLWTGGEKAL